MKVISPFSLNFDRRLIAGELSPKSM